MGTSLSLLVWWEVESRAALPARPAEALGGRAVAEAVKTLSLAEREARIEEEIRQGNVPEFWRTFVPITLTREIEGQMHRVELRVAPDYVAVGSDQDYWLVPLSPGAAQRTADLLECSLPTTRIVDAIYQSAAVHLVPEPIPPSAAMTTVAVFLQHQALVTAQRSRWLSERPLGALVAGHKKDVVISARQASAAGKVAIYGWHQTNGVPIQPLYLGHTVAWVDYSHGVRLVKRRVLLDGMEMNLETLLADPRWAVLVSQEGPFRPGHDPALPAVDPPGRRELPLGTELVHSNAWRECGVEYRIEPGVRIMVWREAEPVTNRPVRLVLYATPNGNSIEQTLGWESATHTDWRANIQHIAAQWRWLRQQDSQANWMLAVLEADGRSWPAWRKAQDPGDRRIPEIVRQLQGRWAGPEGRLILTGHSGGGSFTFGFLNGVEAIPAAVERLAFLDSNYAYDEARGHARKIAQWLSGGADRYLCVLAYHDSVALLNGKTFVSENGGTWGRSHAMQRDLEGLFPMTKELGGGFEKYRGQSGRVTFLLKENPEQAIWHSRLVEGNGFIHAMLTGTPREGRGYEYLGPRVYELFIEKGERPR